jgi:predicted acetyltransferase
MGDDADAVHDVLSRSFAVPVADVPPWLAAAGPSHVRVLKDRGRVLACNVHIPMGQFFGGRSVPTVGIAGVGVRPHERGRGAALALMTSTLRELADRGAALSTLYPATMTLYRKVGYENAGARYEITVDVGRAFRDGSLDRDPTPARGATSDEGAALTLRPFEDTDRRAVRKLYREVARTRSGYLDRGDYLWSKVESPTGRTVHGYVVERGGALEGYAFAIQERGAGTALGLRFTDFIAKSGRASRRLLELLEHHRSLTREAVLYGEANLPLLSALTERCYRVALDNPFQVRVVDVVKALEARGYPPGLRGEVQLEVRDQHLSKNHDRFILDVADGLGHVRRGGRGRVKLHVRTLAALYTGHQTGLALAQLGRLDGSDAEIAKLSAMFAGDSSMPDMF